MWLSNRGRGATLNQLKLVKTCIMKKVATGKENHAHFDETKVGTLGSSPLFTC